MGSFEDEAWWSVKYDQDPACDEHGEDEMYFSHTEGEFYCLQCQKEDEITEICKYG